MSEKSWGTTGTSGAGRRHVVQHDWASIRDAMHIAKHEHMSAVDECVSFPFTRTPPHRIGMKEG